MRYIIESVNRRLVKASMDDKVLTSLEAVLVELESLAGPNFPRTAPVYTVQGEYPYSLYRKDETDLLEAFEELCQAFEKAKWKVYRQNYTRGIGQDVIVLSKEDQIVKMTLTKTRGTLPEMRDHIIVSAIRLTPITDKLARNIRNRNSDLEELENEEE